MHSTPSAKQAQFTSGGAGEMRGVGGVVAGLRSALWRQDIAAADPRVTAQLPSPAPTHTALWSNKMF